MTDPKQALLNRGRDTRKLVAIPLHNQTLYFDIAIKSLHGTAGLVEGAPATVGNATAYRFQAGAGADALEENAAIRPGAEIDGPLFPVNPSIPVSNV